MPAVLDIISETKHFLAINKPANLHSVSLQKGAEQSLADLALSVYPELALASEERSNAGFISRLDFQTSGLIIAGRDRESWQKLRTLSARKQIQKRYITVLSGHLSESICVNAWLGSRYRRSKKISCFEDGSEKNFRAQNAETLFKPLAYNAELDLSLVQAEFSIGRRHQVRAHAAHIGHALSGDGLYNKFRSRNLWSGPEFLLHSYEIDFSLNGQHYLKADLPVYFSRFVKENFSDWCP